MPHDGATFTRQFVQREGSADQGVCGEPKRCSRWVGPDIRPKLGILRRYMERAQARGAKACGAGKDGVPRASGMPMRRIGSVRRGKQPGEGGSKPRNREDNDVEALLTYSWNDQDGAGQREREGANEEGRTRRRKRKRV
ncbi:hypothetical protein B0H11DRAFT_1911729 [Mycena galericulata]|nr:hypothetical protein B0H11DRAFT_1911729 [Mycena galericulata]